MGVLQRESPGFSRGEDINLLIQVGNDLSLLYLFSALFGLFDYATAPVVASLVASHLGVRVMGLSMGLLGAGHSLGAAIGAFSGGLVFDSFGSYRGLWLMSIAMAVLAGLVSAFIPNSKGIVKTRLTASL
jgi:MFS family permease